MKSCFKLIFVLCLLASTAVAQTDRVSIALQSEAYSERGQVQLSEVARISGGTLNKRIEIGKIEVAKVNDHRQVFGISQRYVKYCLMLNGYDENEFRIIGAKETTLKRSLDQLSIQVILQKIESKLAADQNLQKDQLELKLLSQIKFSDPGVSFEQIEFVINPESQLRLGRQSVLVRMYHGQRYLGEFNVSMLATALFEVPVTTKRIERDQPFELGSFRFVKKKLTSNRTIFPNLESFQNKAASKTLLPNTEILVSYLKEPNVSQRRSVSKTTVRSVSQPRKIDREKEIIRARQAVIVRAKGPSVNLTLNNATALQGGKKGELIQVRNNSSQKILNCRIVSPSEVEVVYR